MTDSRLTLIHVLAADPPEGGTVRTRSTIRTGTLHVGDRLWFVAGIDRKRRNLTVVSAAHTSRWSTIVFAGSQEDVERVVTGTYIRGIPVAASAGASAGGYSSLRTK